MPGAGLTAGPLARLIRSPGDGPAAPRERCDLCGEGLPDGHRHLFDAEQGEVMCACRPCALLFAPDAAGRGRYRLVPRRRARLAPVPTAALGVPVGLAFFVPRADGTVLAHYPSPAGAARWEVDPAAWRETTGNHPELAALEPDVEALLVHTTRGRQEHWIVPVDDCLRVVAIVRREWKGLSGGSRVWPALDEFFAALAADHDGGRNPQEET